MRIAPPAVNHRSVAASFICHSLSEDILHHTILQLRLGTLPGRERGSSTRVLDWIGVDARVRGPSSLAPVHTTHKDGRQDGP